MMQITIFTLLFVINVTTFFVYAADKHKEVCGTERIPQFLMSVLAVLGGGYGALMAMLLLKSAKDRQNVRITAYVCFTVLLVVIVVVKCFL